jgi:hypothetical protein
MVLGACSSDGGTTTKTFEELFPTENEVAGFTVDSSKGGLKVARTVAAVQGLIDGDADPFTTPTVLFAAFGRQYYKVGDKSVELRIWQMKDAATAQSIYTDLLDDPLYTSTTWTDTPIGEAGRIDNTGSRWWVNARKGAFYVEVSINAPASDQTARGQALALETAVVGGL